MIDLIGFLKKEASNQLVGGGLVLMVTGSVMALMRRAPGQFYGWVRGRFTRTITIMNDDPLFDYVTYWLDSQERFRRSRFLKATTQLRLEQVGNNSGPSSVESSAPRKKQQMKVFFSPSNGQHFFKYRDVLVSIGRPDNGKASAPGGAGEAQVGRFTRKEESYVLTALGKNDGSALKALVQEIIEFGTEETEGVRLYFSVWGHWSSNGYSRMRPLNTVVLPAGTAEAVLEDMRGFRAQEQWYKDLGIPWHKGYLFYGLAGTGKTSLAAATAGELEMDIYLLNLSGTGMNDETLQRLMSNVRPGCMVILEDIDCTVPERDAPEGNKVTLSGLLNCLDGIMSREGCVIVMTTNRREGLDSALVRPGRVDFEMEFGYADHDQILRLARRIGVSAEGLRGGEMTMAEVQKELLERYRSRKAMEAVA
jgi:chaperone BCS1